MSDATVNLFDEPPVGSVEYPAEGKSGALFDKQQIEDTTDDEDSTTYQTIMMTVLFTTLMILYIGFCVYYRRVKIRSSIGDETVEESERRRRQQRRENQVSFYIINVMCIIHRFAYAQFLYKCIAKSEQEVLNESISASTRARNDAAEQAKLEERKKNIKMRFYFV